jgi:Tfp pilus assembly PilM family ATPase
MAAPRGKTVAVGFALEGSSVKYAELVQVGGGRYRVGMWGTRAFSGPEPAPEGEPAAPPSTPAAPAIPLLQPWTSGILKKLRKYPVYASFADTDVLMKFITLPELTVAEVARMVELRHREYLPMPNKEIVYDFSLARYLSVEEEQEGVGTPPAGREPSELRVMVAGVERGIYLTYRESISQEGVILRGLETNQSAITRGCNFLLGEANPGTYAVLYLGDANSVVNFVLDGGLYYSRTLEHGLQTLTPDEAGRRRAERLLREIYRSVDFFSVESRGIPVDTLFLVNGGLVPDLAVARRIQYFLAERLNVDVRVLHDVVENQDRVAFPPGTVAGTLLVPIGLALRSVAEEGGR